MRSQITYGPFERLHFHGAETKIFAAYLWRQAGETGMVTMAMMVVVVVVAGCAEGLHAAGGGGDGASV